MIIGITMKTPDCVDDAVDDQDFENTNIDPEELKEEIKQHFQYGEYINLRYDTDTKQLTIAR